ncbi:uncharacterized protein MONBRDRAFT_39357 [Monosiga brevicollis MX1]|nr:uncharacterized protein MONBRDRAFT_39357 [Monosiga brevicollis MX1]EDQ84245.1 predicted protein [Monosiga brevicollis MX1]|eukprot:XP_001750969.1 hypothetical protein [Monosiga brevicollis MX1]
MWASNNEEGRRARLKIPLGPGYSRFRGLDPSLADTLARYQTSPGDERLFALCRERYTCDKRVDNGQGQEVGLVRKVPSKDIAEKGEIIYAQRHLQICAFLTCLGSSLRPFVNKLRAAFSGEKQHELGRPPAPGLGPAEEAAELLFFAEAMIASTYLHLKSVRADMLSISMHLSRNNQTSNRILKVLFATLGSLLDWFSEDFPENCEPGEQGTSGYQPAAIWIHLSHYSKTWESMRRMRNAVLHGVSIGALKKYRANAEQGTIMANSIPEKALLFCLQADLSDSGHTDSEVPVLNDGQSKKTRRRVKSRSRAKRDSIDIDFLDENNGDLPIPIKRVLQDFKDYGEAHARDREAQDARRRKKDRRRSKKDRALLREAMKVIKQQSVAQAEMMKQQGVAQAEMMKQQSVAQAEMMKEVLAVCKTLAPPTVASASGGPSPPTPSSPTRNVYFRIGGDIGQMITK